MMQDNGMDWLAIFYSSYIYLGKISESFEGVKTNADDSFVYRMEIVKRI